MLGDSLAESKNQLERQLGTPVEAADGRTGDLADVSPS